MPTNIPPWTHSRLDNFKTCPKQFYHLKVARDVVEQETEAIRWGKTVHSAFEYRMRDGTPLPETMAHWEPLAQSLDRLPGQRFCEVELAVDKNFQPAEWNNCWTRGIADYLVVDGDKAAVFDYKTGRRKPSSQLRLYAAKVFAKYPEVKVVSTGFVWLKDRKIDREKLTRADIPRIWDEYLPEVRRLEVAYEQDAWPARPSGLCRAWCPVGRDKCQYCGK